MQVVPGLFELIKELFVLYYYALIAYAIISTLVSFGVLDSRNRIVWSINDFLYKVTDPALRPIRAVLPNFGGVDLSFLVVLLLISYVVIPLITDIENAVVGAMLRNAS